MYRVSSFDQNPERQVGVQALRDAGYPKVGLNSTNYLAIGGLESS